MNTIFNKDFSNTEYSENLAVQIRDLLRPIIHQHILYDYHPFEIKHICYENIDKLINDELLNLVTFINNKEYKNIDEIIITDKKENNIKIIKFETYDENGNKLYKYYEGFYPKDLPCKVIEYNGNLYYVIKKEL